jgi:uncharacterized damage-inducible protein DinB
MKPAELAKAIKSSKEYLDRSSRLLTEENSNFAPKEGMMTAAQQLAHIAATIDWFVAGALSPKGFDLDFEKMAKEVNSVASLKAARSWLEKAYANAIEVVQKSSEADLAKPMAAGMIMGGQPRANAFSGIIEHTAHHRGALTVYSRLVGKVPPMPYMDM